MRATITVFKEELSGKTEILEIIKGSSTDLKEIGDAYIFSPKPGKLFELLNLLRDHKIIYGTNFNTSET